jgi:hypothetical protein
VYEFSYLTRIPAAIGMRGITKVSSAATLVGIEAPGGSKNIEIKPYATAGLGTDRTAVPPVSNDPKGDAGFDFKYGLTRSLTFDFTYNTDFAQVESDEQQVNLTRFSLFFPEKRDFFLEGQGIFAFGGVQSNDRGARFGLAPSNTPILFFSRRIGLSEGREVPIRAGGRLTGKMGPYSLGILSIGSGEEAAAEAQAANFSVFRLKRDVFKRSNVGVIATRRSPASAGRGSNEVMGLDANLSFLTNSTFDAYYARSATPGLQGEEASYRATLELANDRWGFQAEHLTVEENFNPEAGFLRRDDFRRNFVELRFSPRPRSIPSIRKATFEASLDYTTNGDWELETREAQARVSLEIANGDRWSLDYSRNYEFLPEAFEIATGVTLPVGVYRFQDLRSSYNFGPQRKIVGNVAFQTGSFFNGDRTELGYTGRVELSPRLTLEPRVALNWVDLVEGSFVARLVSARVNFTHSPRVLLGALLQYNSSANLLSSNVRFRWEYQPGSDLYIVYSDGRDTIGAGFPVIQSRSLVVKFTRLFRF